MGKNSLKEIREALLMSKAELSRKANVSPVTIARIEIGISLSNGNKAENSTCPGVQIE